MLYQRVNARTGENVGVAAPLPQPILGLTDEVLADLDAALDPEALIELDLLHAGFIPVPPPTPVAEHKISRIAFMQRIPAAKRIAIRSAGKADPVVEDFLDLLAATDTVDLSDGDTLMGVGYLVMQGLLTQAEAEELLA